jgi:D-galactarolactone cycloisomerase
MPTVKRLSFIGLEYAFAPEKAYGMSRGGGNRRQGGLVEVETSDGAVGVGEAFGNPFVTREYFRMVEPFFTGRSVFDFEHIEARIRNAMYHLGVGNQLTSCLAAINVALLDANARAFGVRVCDLIGGCGTTRVPAYASTGFFSDDPGRQLSHMLQEAAGHPFAGAKIKIGRGIRSDVERVRQSREALGPDKLLLVDINGAYTPDLALECARAIEPFGIHWIEEPLPPGDFTGYAELRARSPVPLAAGEAHHTVRDFKRLIDGRCIDIVQPSVPGVGGLTEAKRIATLAQAANLRVAPHVWGGAVGLATAMHLIAALPNTPHTDHPPVPQMLEYDMSEN